MRSKVIIIDLDGTAVDSPDQKLPTERLVSAVTKLLGKYHVCAATGRVWSFAKPVLRGLSLTDPCIISAGTQICNPQTGEILWQQNIDKEALEKVVAVLQQYPDWKILYNDATEEDYFHGGVYPQDFAYSEPVYFFEQVFVPDEKAIEVRDKLNEIEGVVCVMVNAQKPRTKDLHVINREATKEHAIAVLLEMIKVTKENAIGIGDGHNDLHLFNGVGRKVAMGNAVQELKERADEEIGSVKEDGLAVFFEKLSQDKG